MSSCNGNPNNFMEMNSDANYYNVQPENEDSDINNQLNFPDFLGPDNNYRSADQVNQGFISCHMQGFYEPNSNSDGSNGCFSYGMESQTPLQSFYNPADNYFSSNPNYSPISMASSVSTDNHDMNFSYSVLDYPNAPRHLRFRDYYIKDDNRPISVICPAIVSVLKGSTNSSLPTCQQEFVNHNVGYSQQGCSNEMAIVNQGFSNNFNQPVATFPFTNENHPNHFHQEGIIGTNTGIRIKLEPQHVSDCVAFYSEPFENKRPRNGIVPRTSYTAEQVQRLEEAFRNQHRSPNHCEELARELNISPKQVKVWFQNKQSKINRSKKSQTSRN